VNQIKKDLRGFRKSVDRRL